MRKLLSYLNFLLSSTNQHGVHSPFVYNYVTKCLYSKPKKSPAKTINILLKSIRYFDVENIWLPTNEEALHERIKVANPSIQMKSPFDLIFTDANDLDKNMDGITTKIHNDTILLIDSIYKNKTNNDRWRNLKNRDKVTVTIDMYYCGAAFFRKEQVKEHFKIRI